VHSTRRVTSALAAAVTIIAVAATGCGSSSSSNSDSNSGSPGSVASATKLKGKPIVIGSVGSFTGPQAPALGAVDETLNAWSAWTNANGGINGHPVKLLVADDGSNPARATQLVRKLVEQEHVVALVGAMSFGDQTWAPYVQKKGIPVIGAANYNPVFGTNPDFFATGSQIPALVYGLLDQAKRAGKTKLAVLPCAEAPACAEFAKLFQGVSQVVGGVSVAYTAKVTVSQPSYQAVCLAAKSKGVDAMVVIENAETVVRVADNCARAGYKPTQLNLSGTVGQQWTKSASMNGALATQSNPVLADDSIPATKAFHQALDKYGKTVVSNSAYGEMSIGAWAAGQAFALAAERAKLTPDSTPAEVKQGLYTFKNETVGGLTPPLTYTKDKPAFTTCWFAQKLVGQAFEATQGAKPSCMEPAKVKQLATVLGAA
jgi:branched-chain amino acid transport system substrate-binding protein